MGSGGRRRSGKRLGWVEAVAVSRPLVAEILALRDELRADGVDHIVLGGMGGSSLAPEVIARTSGVELTVLDSTDPGQVLSALGDRLASTALVISSKSGSTVETDSQKRIYEEAFRDAGIDPLDRIIVVTDPGSPLDVAARATGYRVFNADPTVGGRYSALTAFGLVPSGLAGVDIAELLDEAEAMSLELAIDSPSNPGLVLGAAIAGTRPLKDKLAIVADGTHIVGFRDWAEQLIAESTGKLGTGILPVVLDVDSPELTEGLDDLQIVRLVDDWDDTKHVADGEIEITGTLGAQLLTWEYATVVAGRMLGINPFDQPDVESAKIATRGLLDTPCAIDPGCFVVGRHRGARHAGRRRRSERSAGAISLALGTPRRTTATSRSRPTSTASLTPQLVEPARRGRWPRRAPRDLRLGSAVPALDRPVPQGRPRRRRVPADHRRIDDVDLADPRAPVHLRPADPRPGRGRRECSRRARSPVLTLTLTQPGSDSAVDHRRSHLTTGNSNSQEQHVPRGDHRGLQPAAVAVRPSTQPHRRTERARHLRRDGRPVAQEAHAGRVRPRQPRPAAARASRSSASRDATGRTRTSRRSSTTRSSSTRAPRSTRTSGSSCCRASASFRASSTTLRVRRASRTTIEELDARARHHGQPRVLPVDPAEGFPAGHRAAAQLGPRRADGRPVAARRHREAVRQRPQDRARAQRRRRVGVPAGLVFRIDHYLGKETVQNILALRFANQLYEPIWNANYVDHVQITMAEDIGVGGRAGYYDGIGAARDVIQNHLLQLLALTAMEEPVSFDAADLRAEKEKVLAAVRLPEGPRAAHRARPVRRRLAGRREGARLPRGGRDEPRVARPRPTPRSGSRSARAAGRECRSTCAPASASAAASPRSPSSSSAPRSTCSPTARPRRSARTRS